MYLYLLQLQKQIQKKVQNIYVPLPTHLTDEELKFKEINVIKYGEWGRTDKPGCKPQPSTNYLWNLGQTCSFPIACFLIGKMKAIKQHFYED